MGVTVTEPEDEGGDDSLQRQPCGASAAGDDAIEAPPIIAVRPPGRRAAGLPCPFAASTSGGLAVAACCGPRRPRHAWVQPHCACFSPAATPPALNDTHEMDTLTGTGRDVRRRRVHRGGMDQCTEVICRDFRPPGARLRAP